MANVITKQFRSNMGAGVPNTLKIIMPDTTVVYNPFEGGDKEVIIEGGSATGIEYISLDYDATELVGIYERISAAIGEGLLPVLIYGNASTKHYIPLARKNPAGYLFEYLDNDISNTNRKLIFVGHDDSIQYTNTPIGGSDESYIKVAKANVNWLENGVFGTTGFTNTLGAICADGNNKNYRGSLSTNMTDCSCASCGFIVFLDERNNPLVSDECRNVSIDIKLDITGGSGSTAEAALATMPQSLWLRVFQIYQTQSGTIGHEPLACSKVYSDGIFVDLNTVHLDMTTSLGSDGLYHASASTRFQVNVIGSQWTYALKGNG